MQRMYSDFYDSPIDASLGTQPTANNNSHAANGSPFGLGHSMDQMSIDEHLRGQVMQFSYAVQHSELAETGTSTERSLPSPPPWLGTGGGGGGGHEQFRHPQESDMLRIGQPKMHMPHQQTSSGGCLQPNVLMANRCDARVPSSSDTSPSSCSPSSSENIHANHHNGSEQTAIANHAMKQEPIDDYLPAMHQMTDGHLLGFGSRCGSSSDSHTPAPARRSRSSQEGMLKCHYCPKKFSTQSTLEDHMRDCQLIRVHECQHCRKRFKARGGLQQHMRIHNNDRPYACHFCQKRFTQKSHVDQHERIHTGAKPFSCQFCGRAFRQRSQQLGHEATHVHAAQENRSVEIPKLGMPSSEDLHLQQHQQQRLPPSSNPAVTGLLALSQQQHQLQQHHLPQGPPSMLSLGGPMGGPSMLQMPDFSHPGLMLNQMM